MFALLKRLLQEDPKPSMRKTRARFFSKTIIANLGGEFNWCFSFVIYGFSNN